jgi:hypothetical protein
MYVCFRLKSSIKLNEIGKHFIHAREKMQPIINKEDGIQLVTWVLICGVSYLLPLFPRFLRRFFPAPDPAGLASCGK